jgi:hypothetical protein
MAADNFVTFDQLAALMATYPPQHTKPPDPEPLQSAAVDGTLIPHRAYPGAVFALSSALGVFVGLFIAAIGISAMMIFNTWGWWVYVLLVSLLAAMLSAAGAGITWTMHLAGLQGLTTPKTITVEVESAQPDPVEITRPLDGHLVQIAAQTMLDRHFIFLEAATRDECESFGVAQEHWNQANRVFKMLRLKRERSWETDISFEQARRRWVEAVRVNDDGACFITNGNTTEIIKFERV